MPWMNEDIELVKTLLREIRDSLVHPTVSEILTAKEYLDNIPVPVPHKGRPKGSKNKEKTGVKRAYHRKHRTDQPVQ